MNCTQKLLVLAIAGGLCLVATQPVAAQVVLVGPPVPVPSYASPVAAVPSPYPVVSTYRVPSVAPRVAGYGVYQPVSPAPIYVAPTPIVAPTPVPVTSPVGVVAPNVLYRPAVVGSSISGLPTVYVPGQPVRNALRYVVP